MAFDAVDGSASPIAGSGPSANAGRTNTIVGCARLSVESPVAATQPTRHERTRQFSVDSGPCTLSIVLTTLVANWYSIDARRLLLWGTDPLRAPIGTDAELRRFLDELATQPAAALLRLTGAWSLAFVDASARRVLFASDRAARRPVCFHVDERAVTFGLSARDVSRALQEKPQLRAQAIFDYMRGHVIPAPDTIYAGVQRLLPGQYADVRGGEVATSFYWQPSYEGATDSPAFAHASGRLLTLLSDSVRRNVGQGKTGAFLSGGTDSSTVAGILCSVTNAPANTYSIGFDAPGYDEMDYARIAARHFKTRHHEYYVTPDDLVAAIRHVAAAYDQPFGNSSALPAYYCARLAADDGVERLLGGDGGDEIFGGNTRYAKQTLFDAYRRMPAAIDRTLVETALVQRGYARRLPGVSKLRSYVVQARVPMPDRLHTYNLIDSIGVREVFTEEFLRCVKPQQPVDAEREWYRRCTAQDVVNRMLQYDWKYTLSDNDLPKVTTTCDLAGVEIAFPMLDEALVGFANALPTGWKVSRLRLRPFFKSALSSFLPQEIVRKRKHGFGLPFGTWLVQHEGLRRLALDALATFKQRGIVRASLVDELFESRLAVHPGYYGELVFTMMMLELWLRSSGDGSFPSERDENAVRAG